MRHWLDPVCGWLSFGIALSATLLQSSPSTQWCDDSAIVRGLGLASGPEAAISSALIQLFSLVPIGGRWLRASLVSALAVGLCGALLYALARRLLDRSALTPRLSPPLSLCAALTAVLAPTWQLEGTVAGSAPVAVVFALTLLWLRLEPSVRDARLWLAYGALMAATAIESPALCLVMLAACGVQGFLLRELPPRRSVLLSVGAAAAVITACVLPGMFRPSSLQSLWDLGTHWPIMTAAPSDVAAAQTSALSAWFREVGVVSVALAGIGLVGCLARERTRWVAAPLLIIVLCDTIWPASSAGVLRQDPRSAMRLLSLGALSLSAVTAVHAAALLLQRSRLFMARPAAVLLVVFGFTLLLVTSEDGARVASRRAQVSAEVWTDAAFSGLPPRAIVLVRSEAVALRLRAARLVRGERPDVVVVPLSLLDRGAVAAALLRREPALAPLIREMALAGRPTEFALSTLADARPVYLEFEPMWDRRLLDHLVPKPFWLEFTPHALGRSDRVAALEAGRADFRRVLAVAEESSQEDPATLAVLAARAREQALMLAALGDRKLLEQVLTDLEAFESEREFLKRLRARLAERERGRVSIVGLFE